MRESQQNGCNEQCPHRGHRPQAAMGSTRWLEKECNDHRRWRYENDEGPEALEDLLCLRI